MESKEHMARIHKDVDRRNSTDIRVQPALVLIVLIVFICVAVYQMTQLSSEGADSHLQSAGVFVTGVGVVISIMYLLMSRRYAHDDRDLTLMRDMLAYARDMFEYYGIREFHYLNTMRSCIKAESGLRTFRIRFLASVAPAAIGLVVLVFNATNPTAFYITCALFSISLAINIVMLVMCITYPREHEKRFTIFSDSYVDAMARCGIRVKGYEPVISYRPFWVFLVASIVTVGVFFAYWLYLSIVDMNRHIDEQWVFENNVMSALKEF
jgi:membrane protein YdbS with pleckstrin-like domain